MRWVLLFAIFFVFLLLPFAKDKILGSMGRFLVCMGRAFGTSGRGGGPWGELLGQGKRSGRHV